MNHDIAWRMKDGSMSGRWHTALSKQAADKVVDFLNKQLSDFEYRVVESDGAENGA